MPEPKKDPTAEPRRKRSLIEGLAAQFGVEPAPFLSAILGLITPRRMGTGEPIPVPTEVQVAFLLMCQRYTLDPFAREIYLGYDEAKDRWQPIVGVDGWIRIVQRQKQYNGCELVEVFDEDTKEFVGVRAMFHRRDQEHPVIVTEWLNENRRSTTSWNDRPRRMNRHRAYIQGARLAFGLTGIMETDEWEQFVESRAVEQIDRGVAQVVERAKALLDSRLQPVPSAASNAAREAAPVAAATRPD